MFGALSLASGGNGRSEGLEWQVKRVSCPGQTVQTVGNGIEFVLTVDREIGAIGPILKSGLFVCSRRSRAAKHYVGQKILIQSIPYS
jgi:hypothetical protein